LIGRKKKKKGLSLLFPLAKKCLQEGGEGNRNVEKGEEEAGHYDEFPFLHRAPTLRNNRKERKKDRFVDLGKLGGKI